MGSGHNSAACGGLGVCGGKQRGSDESACLAAVASGQPLEDTAVASARA